MTKPRDEKKLRQEKGSEKIEKKKYMNLLIQESFVVFFLVLPINFKSYSKKAMCVLIASIG